MRLATSSLPAAALVAVLVAACARRDAPPPASWEPDRSCASSEECQPAPSCCPTPCTSDVINRKESEKARRRVDATCSPEQRAACPQAGSCPGHLYACVRARCALVMEGSEDWPKRDAAPP